MENIDYKWPDEFIDGVPPENAIPAEGKVYRLVNTIPPSEKDFLQTREENPKRKFKTKEDVIKSFGVSVWEDKETLKKNRHYYRKAIGHKKIVSGYMEPQLGVASQPEKNSHRSLWKQIGSKPHLLLKKAEE